MRNTHTRRRAMFYKILFHGLDWLYPPYCVTCGQLGWRWCPDCQQRVVPFAEPICEVCGIALDSPNPPGLCSSCRQHRPPFQALRSWAAFAGPLRTALHHLKYRNHVALSESLGEPLANFAQRWDWPVDVVIPVPLGSKRLAQRGYNQAALLALFVAAKNGWDYCPQALLRRRETRSQVGLSLEERRTNVQDAFIADERRVRGCTILLVDDVATTGATLGACAQALRDAGAQAVYALTLARAMLGYDSTQGDQAVG